MSGKTTTAIVIAAAGTVLIVVARWLTVRAVDHYIERLSRRKPPDEVASQRTRLTVLTRVGVATLFIILALVVLAQFPATRALAKTLLASSAVLAVLFGLAFTTPLSNLGSGLLLAFSQPVRLGDRITVGDHTGTVDEISLITTALLTDDDRRVFIPNSQMVSSVVVNRTIEDPRRTIVIRLPVKLGAPLDQARAAVLEAVRSDTDTAAIEDVGVLVSEVDTGNAWLTLTAYAPAGSKVAALASDLREGALGALQKEGFLPGLTQAGATEVTVESRAIREIFTVRRRDGRPGKPDSIEG